MLINEAKPWNRLGVNFREINKEQGAKETSSDPRSPLYISLVGVFMEFRKTEELKKGIMKGLMK